MAKYSVSIDSVPATGIVASPPINKAVRTANDGVTMEWTNSLLQIQETIVSTAGQTIFSLKSAPINADCILMYINGIGQTYSIDFVLSASTVTYVSTDCTLINGDKVEFWYVTLSDVFDPLMISGATAWYNPKSIGSLIVDTAYTGANLFVDGNMEDAGTAAWTLLVFAGSANVTKEIVSPHSGTRNIKIEKTGASGSATLYQNICTNDKVYFIDGWTRSGTQPRITLGAQTVWSGSPLASWQYAFGAATSATNQRSMIGDNSLNPPAYIEWDDCRTIKLPSITQLSDLTGNGNHAALALGAQNPAHYRADDNSLWFSSAQAGKEKYLTSHVLNATAGTVWCWFWVDAWPATDQCPFGVYDGGSGKMVMNVTGAGGGQVKGALGTGVTLVSSNLANLGAWNFLCVTWDGSTWNINLNGTISSQVNTGVAPTSRPMTIGCANWNGANINYFTGRLMQIGTYNKALSVDEQTRLRNGTNPLIDSMRGLPLGTVGYYDPAFTSTVTPYQDFAYTGAEILVDADMEAALPGPWIAFAGATPSKENDPRPGSTGTKCIRATLVGGAGGVGQTGIFSASQRFRVSAWLKTDGTATEYVYDGVNACFSPSTYAANVWAQRINNNFLPGNTICYFWKLLAGGNYIQADDASVTRLPIVTRADSIITGGAPLTQAGATGLRPTYLNTAAAAAQSITAASWIFDGVGQSFASTFIPGTAGTIAGWFYLDSVAATNTMCGSNDGVINYTGISVAAGGTPQALLGNNPANIFNHPTLVIAGTWHHYAVTWNGASGFIYLDGIGQSGTAGTQSTTAIWLGGRNNNGVMGPTPMKGYNGGLVLSNRAFTAAEIQSIYYGTYRT